MQEVIFNLRTITPLFMAGNDQKEIEIPFKFRRERPNSEEIKFAWEYTAELRPPAFRGLMRYWQRAVIGGIVGTDDDGIADMARIENAVFGTTDRGSAVNICISEISHAPVRFTESTGKLVGDEYQATGKGYLFWSMSKSGKGKKYKPHRSYFPPNTSFKVKLSSRNQDTTSFNQAIAAFWLLINLGGVGSRSRRCAGSLIAKPLQPLTGNVAALPFKEPRSVEELKTHLEQGIQTVRSLYEGLTQRLVEQPHFDILSLDACKIWILRNNEKWHGPDDAMQGMGESLQEYRRQFNEIKAHTLLGEHIPQDHNGFDKLGALEIFGLPLGKNQARRASPLLLKITKLQGEYVCVAVLFKTTIEDIPQQSYAIIEDWINTFPMKVEVDL